MGLFWQKAGFCTGPRLYVVVFTVDDVLWPVVDSLLTWTLTAVGPSDAESWIRAETYYIRILNVSPESVFWWRGAVLPSQFLLSQFCWVSYLLTRRVNAESVLLSQFFCWQGNMIPCGNVLYTYNKSFAYFAESVFAESDKAYYCCCLLYTSPSPRD